MELTNIHQHGRNMFSLVFVSILTAAISHFHCSLHGKIHKNEQKHTKILCIKITLFVHLRHHFLAHWHICLIFLLCHGNTAQPTLVI